MAPGSGGVTRGRDAGGRLRDTVGMVNPRLITALAMPLFMVAGALAVWLSRGQDEDSRPKWRDDSLDDWFREREAKAEEERRRRQERGDDE